MYDAFIVVYIQVCVLVLLLGTIKLKFVMDWTTKTNQRHLSSREPDTQMFDLISRLWEDNMAGFIPPNCIALILVLSQQADQPLQFSLLLQVPSRHDNLCRRPADPHRKANPLLSSVCFHRNSERVGRACLCGDLLAGWPLSLSAACFS